ncbi:MAG: type II toxin-antitoxin system RelE/ParE family toxin [Gammaproteobacteria bacterium]|nr:type II toxin-antitoxin system RelE/ParE family toxin [Gammaproteobacteria bacterium]MDP2346343.1 type II toxin-antitoxin system RelE/ParE family toxin [Gammaproteobacteria bacterium]
MKDLEFIGSSQEDLKAFPEEARRDAGFQLHFVQMGQLPADWKTMQSVGANTMELRIHRSGEWRIIYVAKFRNAVCVLHAFEKKTQKTRQSDIALARKRYREVEIRESKGEQSKEVKP